MDLLVFVESRNGKVRSAGLEAVTYARKLADMVGGKLNAILVGKSLSAMADEVEKYGPDRLYLVENPELEGYSPDGYREALVTAMTETGSKCLILSASVLGRDLAPVVTAALDAALLPDCTEVEYVEGRLTVTRPVYAGRCIMTLSATAWPVVLSLRPKAFLAATREGVSTERVQLSVDLEGKIKTHLIETREEAGEKLDVSEADIVVAGGRGLKSEENFGLIEELSGALGGAVGTSRATVDAGWRPHSEQVGQTGKVVNPTLYFAVGISGAIQHLAGMRTSKVIVAINKDADAPIFKSADFGIVGDALEVLPALTRAIMEMS